MNDLIFETTMTPATEGVPSGFDLDAYVAELSAEGAEILDSYAKLNERLHHIEAGLKKIRENCERGIREMERVRANGSPRPAP